MEAAVFTPRLDHRLGRAAHHAQSGVLPEVDVVLPHLHLVLRQLCRVRHHARCQLHEGAGDVERVGIGKPGLGRVAGEIFGNQLLAALGDLRHILGKLGQALLEIFRGLRPRCGPAVVRHLPSPVRGSRNNASKQHIRSRFQPHSTIYNRSQPPDAELMP